MIFSEFKRLLGADPWNRDPETLRARHSAPEFEQAARDAEAFEHKLQSALLTQPPAELLANIKKISLQQHHRRNWMPLALAASLLIAVGAVGMVWKQSHQWDSVEAYIADHYAQDGAVLLGRAADPVPAKDINRIMARLNASAGQQLTRVVKFIKFCPTPKGRGVHMIVSTDQGPMTIVFMPETQVTDGEMVEFDQMHAYLLNLKHGSVAIIGERSQSVKSLEAMVRSSLQTGMVGA